MHSVPSFLAGTFNRKIARQEESEGTLWSCHELLIELHKPIHSKDPSFSHQQRERQVPSNGFMMTALVTLPRSYPSSSLIELEGGSVGSGDKIADMTLMMTASRYQQSSVMS